MRKQTCGQYKTGRDIKGASCRKIERIVDSLTIYQRVTLAFFVSERCFFEGKENYLRLHSGVKQPLKCTTRKSVCWRLELKQ